MKTSEGKEKVTIVNLIIWGIICLIPILGGVVGTVLIIRELISRKNKWLMLNGAIGIIISAFVLIHINYLQKHRGAFDRSRIIFAQQLMQQVLKEIEFYKIKNNKYPDSLQDLHLNNYLIEDPVQEVNPHQPQEFFYKKDDQKYYFFSKGFDGVPFTPDDILPDINGRLGKFGLIIAPHASTDKVDSSTQ